jgi:hypothetical protein
MRKRSIFAFVAVCLLLAGRTSAQQAAFPEVKTRFSKSPTDRVLVDKSAELVLDDGARQLVVKNAERPLTVGYDAIQKIVFDVSTHMRGGAMSQLIGGVAGAVIAGQRVNDYWCYLEYRDSGGTVQPYMIEVPKESSANLIEKMRAVFAEKVTVTEFTEKDEPVEKSTLKELQSKHDIKVNKQNHPMPEVRPGQALLVVVAPPLAARFSGKGVQMKLHANDKVVAVNKQGTYSLVYLDPGDYLLVSQAGNAGGFRMTLEAGKEYYLLQDTFSGMMKAGTTLSRHSKELVMYELNGANLSDWTQKK